MTVLERTAWRRKKDLEDEDRYLRSLANVPRDAEKYPDYNSGCIINWAKISDEMWQMLSNVGGTEIVSAEYGGIMITSYPAIKPNYPSNTGLPPVSRVEWTQQAGIKYCDLLKVPVVTFHKMVLVFYGGASHRPTECWATSEAFFQRVELIGKLMTNDQD